MKNSLFSSLKILLKFSVAVIVLSLHGCKSFTIVLLPDTQYYSNESGGETYLKQTKWIIDHAEEEKIRFVIHLGDITHQNRTYEWKNAVRAHAKLDGNIPYSMVPGNHDNPNSGRDKRNTQIYNQSDHFGPEKFDNPGNEWYGGHMDTRNDNNFCYFDFDDLKFLVLSLEFAPTKDALCWANSIIKQHPEHRVIIVTHCYLNHDGKHREDCATEYNIIGSSGSTVWNELAKNHSNVFLILSGHITGSIHHIQEINGDELRLVHEILTDYQGERKDNDPYGNGWLKTLTFVPKLNKVQVKTITVLKDEGMNDFNYRDGNNRTRYPLDPEDIRHQYTFDYNMTDEISEYVYMPDYIGFSDRTMNEELEGANSRHQRRPQIGMDSDGDFVVVWEDDCKDPEGIYQIYARGFYSNGCEKFSRITVNERSAGQQYRPDIAVDQDGNFVVVWEDDSRGPNGTGPDNIFQIYAAGFDETGDKVWGDSTVNERSAGQQKKPKVDMNAQGRYVVVWEDDSRGPNGTGPDNIYQIYAAGFNFHNAGKKVIHDFTVNERSAGQQYRPNIAVDQDGKFVVVWEDDSRGPNGTGPDNIFQIYAAGFDETGDKIWGDSTVNRRSAGQQKKPKVDMNAQGRYVVVWEDDSRGPNGTGPDNIYQIYAAGFNFHQDGRKIMEDFTVNQVSAGQQYYPDIEILDNNNFVVVWQDDSSGPEGVPNNIFEIFAAGFKLNNPENRLFQDITINTDGSGDQKIPSISMNDDGKIVIVWQDDVNSNTWWEIVGRGLHIETIPDDFN